MSIRENEAMRMTSGAIAVLAIVFSIMASTDKPVSPAFDQVYKHIKPGYTPQTRGANTPGRDVMICIMPDSFASVFQPYAAWKHKSGMFIKIVNFSDIGATAATTSCSTAIKPYIKKAYDTWKYKPSYVLLIGDAGIFPLKKYSTPGEGIFLSNVTTDEYFGETDFSNKYEPDIMVGRLCVKDIAELRNLLGKIMGYERNPPTANTAWFRKTLGISSNQVNNGTGVSEGPGLCGGGDSSLQAETVRKTTKMQMDAGYNADTLMCTDQFKGDQNTVIDAINKGVAWINYRGQGWAQGWLTSCYTFYGEALSKVNTKGMLPFITGIGCGIAMFDVSPGGLAGRTTECFGEEFMRLGTADAPNGAIAVIGTGGETHACWNNAIDLGLYDGVFLYGIESPTPGQAFILGIDSMYKDKQLNIVNTDTADYLARLYLILGDPSTHIWKEVPQIATLTGPTHIPSGTSTQTFSVQIGDQPVKDAQICISGALTDSVTWFTGFTDANGSANLSITASDGVLSLVARAGRIFPIERQIAVGTGSIGVLNNPPVGSTALRLKVGYKNHPSLGMTIAYWLPRAQQTTVALYSLQGTLVRTIASGVQSAGYHSIEWKSGNEKGIMAAGGIYIISLRQGSNVAGQRITKID
jgi:hypothetical protein